MLPLPWTHPHLTQSVNPIKGRQLLTVQPIQRGEVVLIDPPYAIIPTATPAGKEENQTRVLICSNPQCNRLVSQRTGTACSNRCIADVIWCDETCQRTDEPRHGFECVWLSRYAASLRAKWGEYNFGMLWIIVRMLARRTVPTSQCDSDLDASRRSSSNESSLFQFKDGWDAMEALCGSTETWSHAQVREWGTLVKKYLSRSSLPHKLSNDEVLALICKEEANSFGLYPQETGVFPIPSPSIARGEQLGAAVYPRASIANHSCCPNIIHKPDQHGRMNFTAGRDIAAGEECCISYFDLAQYIELKDRRGHLQGLFRFKCGCARCLEEDEPEESELQWDEFPGLD